MRLVNISNNYYKLKNSQKKGAGTPAYTRFVNRWLGRVIASFLACFKISPNQLSLISGTITTISFVMFLLIEEINLIHSTGLVIMLFFAYALDSADGQLARLLDMQSKKGEWLDHTLDAIKIPLGHGVAIFLVIKNGIPGDIWIIFYLTILSLACTNFLSGLLKSKLLAVKSSFTNTNKEESRIIRSFLTLPLDYGIFIMLFLFTAKPDFYLILYRIWGGIFILYSFVFLIKSWREMIESS